jgi:hypothetical protein
VLLREADAGRARVTTAELVAGEVEHVRAKGGLRDGAGVGRAGGDGRGCGEGDGEERCGHGGLRLF